MKRLGVLIVQGLLLGYWSGLALLQAQPEAQLLAQARAARQNGEFQQAIALYSQVLNNNPRLGDAYAERGFSQARLKQYQDALYDYADALQYGGLTHEDLVWYNQGWAFFNLGDKPRACESWQKALTLGYQPAQEALQKHCQP
jgi:tetratricopeptide (TPR) repeat protein